MHGMFKANGGCGYIKKPDFLLKAGDEVFDPRATLPVKTTLKVSRKFYAFVDLLHYITHGPEIIHI